MWPRLVTALILLPGLAFGEALQHLAVEVVLPNTDLSVSEVDIEPTLGMIPGAIFGAPLGGLAIPISGAGVSRISFPLRFLVPVFDKLAQSYASEFVSVTPVETRIARVSTGGFVAEHPKHFGGGFKHPVDSFDMILLYVDRPCTIFGREQFVDDVFTFDLHFEQPGFHWLSIDPSGNFANVDIDELVQYELFYQ